MTTQTLGLILSLLALVVSGVTAWLTLFKRGIVKMTQPTVIYFGPDSKGHGTERPLPKVFLRSLLFSTSKRGRIIESMHVSLARSETVQNFNIWVYGSERLVRGSGIFVGESGVAANHHFLTPTDASNFEFLPGAYHLTVYAHLLGDRSKILLFERTLEVSKQLADELLHPDAGLYFDWGPDSSEYVPHIEKRLPDDRLIDFLMANASVSE